jgi:eukaryotic-like serine/threonine-protein kinase
VAPWTESSERIFRFDAFEVDLWTGELRKHGIKVKVQDQPLKVLAMLLAEPGELVTRERLREGLWSDHTFVDFDRGLNTAVKRLRAALNDSAEHPRYVETVGRRGYRFIASLSSEEAKETVLPSSSSSKQAFENPVWNKKLRQVLIPAFAVLSAAVIGDGVYHRSHSGKQIDDKDTIVLADFANATGDPVFDGTLRQGLSIQLEQSPFLSIISDQQIQQTLQMMGQNSDAKLTPAIARELCQRTGSAAVLDGSIAQIGAQYLLTLKAVTCASGESLASTEAPARDKNHVLDALGKIASDIRQKLGESLSTAKKLDIPLEQATTPSLEALQSYSLGRTEMVPKGDEHAAVPLFQRAIQLDPNFAMAYASLGTTYFNLGEDRLGADNTKKAYELRERLSQRERFYIEAHYYDQVTGDLEKARQVYELWAQTFPRDPVPPDNLAGIYAELGQHEKLLEVQREALRLDSANGSFYADLVETYMFLNRFEDGRATAEQAISKKLDTLKLHDKLYLLAFLRSDAAEMSRQGSWGLGKPGMEDIMLAREADTAAYFGRLRIARELSRRAVVSSQRAGQLETAASYEAFAALRESLLGNAGETRQRAAAASKLSNGRDVQAATALALALAGDLGRSQTLAADLVKRFQEDTVVQVNYLPTIRAVLELNRNNLSGAIEATHAAAPYELGVPVGTEYSQALYPIYVRGGAYLRSRRGSEAAVEFQKILDHRGIVLNEPIGALAHLQIGRAYAMQGDRAKARAAYQDFPTLWKDADPDIPIFIAAKAECAKLQ